MGLYLGPTEVLTNVKITQLSHEFVFLARIAYFATYACNFNMDARFLWNSSHQKVLPDFCMAS